MNDNSIIGKQSYYSVLSDDHVDPPAPPQCTSTPVNSVRHKSEKNVSKPANKLTTIIVNTQSIKSKNGDDMESHWYPKTRNSCGEWNMAEVLPTNYEAIRKDRIDGGVLIAVKNTLISQDLEIKSDCEIVVSRIECSKKNRPWLSSQCTDQHMIILFMRMLLQTPLSISVINIPWTPYGYSATMNLPDID